MGCAQRFSKEDGIPFYRFPSNTERRRMWVAPVGRKDWALNEYAWICGKHLISGCKSNDPASPDYAPTVFDHVKSPQKRRLVSNMTRYERTMRKKKRRVDNDARTCAAQSLLELSESGAMVQSIVNHILVL